MWRSFQVHETKNCQDNEIVSRQFQASQMGYLSLQQSKRLETQIFFFKIKVFLNFSLFLFPLIYQEVRPGRFDYSFRKGVFESDRKRKLGKLCLLSPAGFPGMESRQSALCPDFQDCKGGRALLDWGEPPGSVLLLAWDAGRGSPHRTWVGVFVSGATIPNYYKLSGLKPQKCIISRFWKPEVQSQGMGRASELCLSQRLVACWRSLAFSALQLQHFSLCLGRHMAFSPHASVCLYLFSWHQSHWIKGPL